MRNIRQTNVFDHYIYIVVRNGLPLYHRLEQDKSRFGKELVAL